MAIQGQEQKTSFGHVNAPSGLSDDVRYIRIDVPIQPGNSGGPLLSDEGTVVGIVLATINQGAVLDQAGTLAQNVNFAVKSDHLRPLLAQSAIEWPSVIADGSVMNSAEEIVATAEGSVVVVVASSSLRIRGRTTIRVRERGNHE